MLKNTLNAGTYFSSLHYIKTLLLLSNMHEHSINFWASALARTVQSIVSNPLTVIKTRLEVLGFAEYNNLNDAMIKIY